MKPHPASTSFNHLPIGSSSVDWLVHDSPCPMQVDMQLHRMGAELASSASYNSSRRVGQAMTRKAMTREDGRLGWLLSWSSGPHSSARSLRRSSATATATRCTTPAASVFLLRQLLITACHHDMWLYTNDGQALSTESQPQPSRGSQCVTEGEPRITCVGLAIALTSTDSSIHQHMNLPSVRVSDNRRRSGRWRRSRSAPQLVVGEVREDAAHEDGHIRHTQHLLAPEVGRELLFTGENRREGDDGRALAEEVGLGAELVAQTPVAVPHGEQVMPYTNTHRDEGGKYRQQ